MTLATGTRITIRGEDFLVSDVKGNQDAGYVIDVQGISELVKGKRFRFDTNLDQYEVLHPANSRLIADVEAGYRKTKLFLETQLRNAASTSNQITIAQKGAFNLAEYQLTPTLKTNAKFWDFIKKPSWDIIVIDDFHIVANTGSQGDDLAQFLTIICEALELTSATPHNKYATCRQEMRILMQSTRINQICTGEKR